MGEPFSSLSVSHWQELFGNMREWAVANVVQQRRKADQPPMPWHPVHIAPEGGDDHLFAALNQAVEQHRRHVHHAESVLKARVRMAPG